MRVIKIALHILYIQSEPFLPYSMKMNKLPFLLLY